MILGRAEEMARLERLLADARAGCGGALVVRGEAGIGKSALLNRVAATATDMSVLRGVGIESEIEVPFAGLHLLFHAYLDRVDALPVPQAAALRSAMGLTAAGGGERFLVGAATLSLLSELAGDRPMLCIVDDAQWFDQASADALLFAARRLRREPVAVLFAVREEAGRFASLSLDVLALPPLDRASAGSLLDERAKVLAPPTRARIVAEAGGNPLAILEFAAALVDWKGSGRALSTPVEPLPVTRQVQEAFQSRIGDLPEATQRLLVVAAADDTADLTVVVRAGERLGLSATDLEPAERARLVELTADSMSFRHPLVRSAAYRGATRGWLVAAHKALAATLDGPASADRRAWHLAAATTGPDEAVAADLEGAARRAAQRGGSAAVAAALERAAALSGDPDRKARRLVGAARAAYDAGYLDRAASLSAAGVDLAVDRSTRAQAAWIQAQVAYERDSPVAAAALMVRGASPIVASHPAQAVSILTDAVGCAKDAGALDLIRESADLLGAVTLEPGSALRPVIDGMVGLRLLLDGRTKDAVTGMRALVDAARRGQVNGFVERVLAGYVALIVADDEPATEVLEALAADTRRQGALGWLPYAQEPLAISLVLRGRFREAETVVAEALDVSTDLGQDTQAVILSAIPAWLAAVAGDAVACEAMAGRMRHAASRHPTNAALATWALGLLDLGRGRFAAAAQHLEAVCAGPARHDFLLRAIPDQVEAAVRGGDPARATRFLPALRDWAEHADQPHAAALVRRCDALCAAGGEPEAHYDAALALISEAGRPYDHARTALLFGEWLRRQRRRTEAHTYLARALSGFESLGAEAWAARARSELAALGDRPVARPHDRDPLARLTPQERQVVLLAAAGLSNRDIAARLFLSPRTIGYHLYRAYPKLGVTRRTDLADRFSRATP
ncbi:AAA family ATPase [Asanoa sp. NPDC050611]|uniref:ATP-binding protein n=1 Tax=Asanoa sp. NPDC050611 TaxID=3157098 RepID=UPI0033C18381